MYPYFFRHLQNVSHIGKLVIASEEAIAKGIRRIVGLTGPEAERAIHRADRLEARLAEESKEVQNKDIISNKEKFKALQKKIQEIVDEANGALLPYWRKDAIRESAKGLQKTLDGYSKAVQAAVAEKILAEAKELAAAPEQQSVLVHVFSPNANSKAIDNALKLLKDVKAVMAFSVNEDNGKVLCMAKVDKTLISNGLKANDWVNEVCTVLGGRGGGKDANAQATGDRADKVDAAVELAYSFAKTTIV
ncbi:unnamed protein product [Caenorhabditis bovis]|uniref:DHHA1 domain-containing protein n=1 Tax=Caenorhabditis bovis TaxID=2654633 RepID=A0A8S1EXJ8_9PELO|nr:unnamed protein product [Caenorhabditis bovis]